MTGTQGHDLLIVGGGRMGAALLGGLLAAGGSPASLAVVEPLAARREELAAELPGVTVLEKPEPANSAVLAVKPGIIPAATAALAEVGVERVLSIAGGVRIAAIEEVGGEGVRVLRGMPNTPALIGCGASALCAGATATVADVEWAEGILGAVGVVERVPESSIDAVTGLSGSGPAYVFLVAEAMVEAGVLNGLPRDLAETLAHQTILGAARLLVESTEGAGELRAGVTSPGGTTAAGLRELERSGTRAAFLDAVTAAAERSRELGGD